MRKDDGDYDSPTSWGETPDEKKEKGQKKRRPKKRKKIREKNSLCFMIRSCRRLLFLIGRVDLQSVRGFGEGDSLPSSSPTLQKKDTSMMIRVCHSRSHFLSCMYIHDDFMTESR